MKKTTTVPIKGTQKTGRSKAAISFSENPIILWLKIFPAIDGAFWMKSSDNKKITSMCIPIRDKNRVPVINDPTERYALIPKNSTFIINQDKVKSIVSQSKERIDKLTYKEALSKTTDYAVYYIPSQLIDVN
jgi:hypothetical protein